MNAIADVLTVAELDDIDPPAETALAIAFVDLTIGYVMQATGLNQHDLESPRRTKDVVDARAMFVWLVKHYRPGISYRAIGRWLGNRDHKGLIGLHARAVQLRTTDPEFLSACETFAQICRRSMEVPYACD